MSNQKTHEQRPLDLDEIREYCGKATPGNLKVQAWINPETWAVVNMTPDPNVVTMATEYRREADANWHARARTDLPRLVAELQAARERIADLESAAVEWNSELELTHLSMCDTLIKANKRIAELEAAHAFLGIITKCQNCDGSGENAHGDCCRIPGHAKDCACVLCQWKTAMYREENRANRLERERDEANTKLTESHESIVVIGRVVCGLKDERDEARTKAARSKEWADKFSGLFAASELLLAQVREFAKTEPHPNDEFCVSLQAERRNGKFINCGEPCDCWKSRIIALLDGGPESGLVKAVKESVRAYLASEHNREDGIEDGFVKPAMEALIAAAPDSWKQPEEGIKPPEFTFDKIFTFKEHGEFFRGALTMAGIRYAGDFYDLLQRYGTIKVTIVKAPKEEK